MTDKAQIFNHEILTYFKIDKEWYGQNKIITVKFNIGKYAGKVYEYSHDELYDNTIYHYCKLDCWDNYGFFVNTRNIPKIALEYVKLIF
ncbi:MAG: hypothetical protein KA210_05305 [Bacteroidia bacterium]|jgi:hypothetical protein|nr:hypothetical protein [Bacteroidia bacterium]